MEHATCSMKHGSRDGTGYPHIPIYKIGAIIRHPRIMLEWSVSQELNLNRPVHSRGL